MTLVQILIGLIIIAIVVWYLQSQDDKHYHRMNEQREMGHRHRIESQEADKVAILGGNAVVSYQNDIRDPKTTYPMLDMASEYFRSNWNVPQNYHFKPSNTSGVEPPLATERKTPSSPSVDEFLKLYRQGMFKSGLILMGFDVEDGSPIYVEYEHLYSLAMGGKTRSGKTNTIRNILGQTVFTGGKFAVIDPHMGAKDSLASSLVGLDDHLAVPMAKEDTAILAVLATVLAEGRRRIDQNINGAPPLLLVADEFTGLVRSSISSEIIDTFEEITQQYAKYNIFAIAAGQIWTAKRMGGSDLRDSFASAVVHRSKQTHARTLINDVETSRAAVTLPQGQCFFEPANGDIIEIKVPFAPMEQLQAVIAAEKGQNGSDFDGSGGFSGSENYDNGSQNHDNYSENHTEPRQNYVRTSVEPWSEDEVRVINLYRNGASKTAIYNTVFHGHNKMSRQAAFNLINKTLARVGEI